MKKILISTIAIVMAISMVFVFTDTSSAEPTSGECGENLTWSYDPDATTLTISGEGTAIQDYASAGSPWHDLNVTNVVFDCPNLTTIGAYAFEDSNMSNHKLPYKITTINEGAFRNCYMLALEKLPDKLTTIGNGAFEHCIRLNIMTIPYGVTVLGPNVFKDCMGIHVMIIPSSITSIDNTAFEDTTGLTTVGNLSTVDITGKFPYMTTTITASNSAKGGTYYGCGTDLDWYYFDVIKLMYIEGPGTTIKDWGNATSVSWYNFRGDILNVELNTPQLTSIGNYTFCYLSNTSRLNIIPSVTYIGVYGFNHCTELILTELPEDLETIGEYAFQQCDKITISEIPSKVSRIERYTFHNCPAITTMILGENISYLGDRSFASIHFTDLYYNIVNSTRTNENPFSGSVFTRVHIGENVENIPYSLSSSAGTIWYYDAINCQVASGSNTYVSDIIFGDKVEVIPANMCSSTSYRLQSVSFNDGIKSIGDYAFQNCTNMVVLSIPESVESIGTSAFAGCSNVMIRTLPEGIHLNPTAFQNCTGITSLVIPGEIGFGPNCFEGCTNLKQILNLSDMEIVAGSDNHGKVAKYADSVQDHIDGVAIVQDKEHVQHETVMDDSITSKLLRFVPVFVSLGLLLGAIAYMYVRRNEL